MRKKLLAAANSRTKLHLSSHIYVYTSIYYAAVVDQPIKKNTHTKKRKKATSAPKATTPTTEYTYIDVCIYKEKRCFSNDKLMELFLSLNPSEKRRKKKKKKKKREGRRG